MAPSPPPEIISRRRRVAVAAAALVLALLAFAVLEAAVEPASERGRQGAEVKQIEIASEETGETLPVSVVVPEGADEGARPLLVFLHSHGSDERSHQGEEMFAALAEQGERAPIVAFPGGGLDSYWHDRDRGDWGGWVTEEVIPRVTEEFGADRRRVAIGGISMGGFGALDLARLNPGRFCAVAGHSPALWRTGGETAPGAFDDAEDFAAHDVVGSAASFTGLPVWLDTGVRDPFRPGIDAFAASLEAAGADLRLQVWPGGHDGAYWDRHWSDYMRFYAAALSRC